MSGPGHGGRSFGFLDHAALWGSLGVTLYLMPFGSLLVPALSIERAVLATALAALIGALLIAAVAAAAARSGSPAIGLLTSVFGQRASAPLALLLLVRNVVWGAFALSLIAGSAELLSERALGMGLRPLWVVAFGLAGLGLLLAGPQFAVRKVLRRFGIWLVLLVAAVITLSAYLEFEVPAYLRRPAVGGWPSFWQAVDIMLIAPLLWLPVVADFARFGRSAQGAARGSFLGFFVATLWLGTLGIIYLPAVETADVAGFVAGMNLGLGALILLLILQLDEVFASGYSASVALERLLPSGRRGLAAATAALVIAVALPAELLRVEGTLLVIASLFIPLFAVVLADQALALIAAPARNPAVAGLAWITGFVLYHWISPPDAAWWRDGADWLFADLLSLPFPLTDEVTWLGAAVPAFLAAFIVHLDLGWALGSIARRTPPAEAPAAAQ